jgi:hypothetical protein
MDFMERGKGMIVGAGGHSTMEVAGEPTDKVRMEKGVGDFAEEKVVRNAVEGFGKIDCCWQGPGGGSFFIETNGYCGGELEEG